MEKSWNVNVQKVHEPLTEWALYNRNVQVSSPNSVKYRDLLVTNYLKKKKKKEKDREFFQQEP